MNLKTKQVANKLNELLEKTKDAQRGLKKAAKHSNNILLKNFFIKKSNERCDFEDELKAEIKLCNEDIEEGGSLLGATHMMWMDLKALFSSDNDEAMLEEVIKGERAAVGEYTKILENNDFSLRTTNILQKQKNKIESTLAEVRRLEDLK